MKRVASLDSKKSGFTLLELLIVLAILIVIIGILGTTVWNSYKRALVRAATVQVTNTLTTAVEEFKMEFREYPSMTEGLYVLAGLDNPDAPAAAQQMQMQQQMGMTGQNGMNMNGQMNGGMMNDPSMMGGAGMNMNDPSMMGGAGMNMNDPSMMGGAGMNMNDPSMMGGAGMNMNDPSMMGGAGMNMNDPSMMGGAGMNMNDPTMMGGNMNMTGGMQQTATVNQVVKPKRKITEPFVQEKDLIDPWNNPIKYEWPTTKGDGKKPAIWSMGPDGEDNNGDGDDVINWDASDMSGQMNAQRNAQAVGFQNGMQQNGMQGMNPNMTGGMPGMNTGMPGMDPNMTGGMPGAAGGMPQGGQQQPMF